MTILKCTKPKCYFLNIWLVMLLTTFNSVVFGQTDTSDSSNIEAINNLNQIIQFLENIKYSVENSIIFTEQEVEKMSEYIREGQKMQILFVDNLSVLHPDKTTLKSDLTQQFHFILQSLALYRSDLRNADVKATDSNNKEFDYLINRIPSLIANLKILTPDYKNLDWVNNKIDELNDYLQAAYGNDAPIHFSIEGIFSENVKSIHWSDVKNMSVNRNENKVSISCIDKRGLLFDFNENQYPHIASMHVHFLAFYQKIAESVAENSVNRSTTIQTDLERATQILNELLPNENYYVTEAGIRDKDFGIVIEFSINKQLDKPVIIIDADSSKFEMCCFLGTEESDDGALNDQYYSTFFLFRPEQLEIVNELKAIFDKLVK